MVSKMTMIVWGYCGHLLAVGFGSLCAHRTATVRSQVRDLVSKWTLMGFQIPMVSKAVIVRAMCCHASLVMTKRGG